MSRDIKVVRGQLRQIAKEILPEVMKQELTAEIYGKLVDIVNSRLTFVEQQINTKLVAMETELKDALRFLVRQTMLPPAVSVTSEIPAPRTDIPQA